MSEDGIHTAKYRLLELFTELDVAELDTIEQWITSLSYKEDLENKRSLQRSEKILIQIGNAIKKIVPLEAEFPSETITPPTVSDQSDCNEVNTCHIDEFLYDEDEVEKMVRNGKFKRRYCLDCNSRNVKDLTYISHSMSREQLQYIFKVVLPSDLEEKQILDVGSRLGAVLYGAYHYSNASTIVGVEMNKDWCDVQQRIIEQYAMDSNRIKVVHSDVMERSDLVASSDIIIVNILEFFIDAEKHKQIWKFFKTHIKKGTYLLSNRSMSDTLDNLRMGEELANWLSRCKPHHLENEILFDLDNCNDLYLYTVK